MKSVFREILDAVVLWLVGFLLLQTSIQNFKVEGASMYLAGPALVKAAIGQEIDNDTLGGAETHSSISGTADYYEKAISAGGYKRMYIDALKDIKVLDETSNLD